MTELKCDVLVVGGSLGGVAAAMRAAEMGADVILIEESDWIGGQLTSQGVCTPDENRWIEQGGGTASYRALRAQFRDHYRQKGLSDKGKQQAFLNPGNCWVSRVSVEPKVARSILEEMLQNLPSLRVVKGLRTVEVERKINTVTAIIVTDEAGSETRISSQYFLDATELGELLPLAGIQHVLGAESFAETGEPDAPEIAHPEWVQPFTVPFALELRPTGEDHTIPRPPLYDEMKALQNYHILDGAMKGMFGELGWWSYRRVIAAENFDSPEFANDIAMTNTGSNDFKGGVIPTLAASDRETIEKARLASLGYVYWLQTECPRTDGTGVGYPELKLRGDWFDTVDGIAPHPYIRESRRIRALKTIIEQEIVWKDSAGTEHQAGPRAAFFQDSCGIGHYWLDIHEGGTEEPSRFFETKPFQIPLGALIPIHITNVLAACKNIGTTHLTNGAYRLHPIEWNIGESAGALSAFCVLNRTSPHQVQANGALLRRYQAALLEAGIPLYWWGDLPSEYPASIPAQRLAMDGLWPGGDEVEFGPEETTSGALKEEIARRAGAVLDWPAGQISRGQAAIWLADRIYGANRNA